MKTFSEGEAGEALSRIARRRYSDQNAGIRPYDICLFAWLVAEAARVNCNPFSITTTGMFYGFEVDTDGMRQKICSVGMSLNTIKLSIERLEALGFIQIDRQASTRGQRLSVEITMG